MKIKLNRAGFRELRNSREMVADLDARARRVAAEAGAGFEADSRTGATRARGSVVTGDARARAAAAADPGRLLRALHRGGRNA